MFILFVFGLHPKMLRADPGSALREHFWQGSGDQDLGGSVEAFLTVLLL